MPVTIGEVTAEVTPESSAISSGAGAGNGSLASPETEVRKLRELQSRILVRDARLRAE